MILDHRAGLYEAC
jgi:hypothetical protein